MNEVVNEVKEKEVHDIRELVAQKRWTEMLDEIPIGVTITIDMPDKRAITSLCSTAYLSNSLGETPKRYRIIKNFKKPSVTITVERKE